jgi:hypothetical protein
MKALITSILTIILLNINLLYSQTWPKYYGQTNRYDYVADIVETYDKGYLICGYYSSPDWLKRWGWLIKTDVNGNIIWEKIIENTGKRFLPFAIEQTQEGGVLVCGMSMLDNKHVPIVIKLDACGVKQWCKVFEGSPNTQSPAVDIKETETGDIIVLVNMFGSNPHETIHLFKLSSEGEVLWQEPFATTHNYPNTNLKTGNSLLVTSNGDFLISGGGYWEQPWNPGGPMPLTPLFVMAESDGNEMWVLPYGLNDTIIGRAFSTMEREDEMYVGMAYYYGNANIPVFTEFDDQGQETNFRYLNTQGIDPDITGGTLVKIYSIDSKHYAQGDCIYGPDQSIPVTVVELEDDIFGLDTIVTNYAIQHGHFWPISFNQTLDNKLLSASTITPSSVNSDMALAKLNLNLEYDTAYTGIFTYDSLCIPGPPQSGFIYLNDCDIVLGTEMPTAAEYRNRVQYIPITIYPNPASDHITFALENTEHHRNIELRCYNLLGMQQHQTTILRGQQQATISVSTWPPGMYVAVVYSDGRPVGRGKFVVQR